MKNLAFIVELGGVRVLHMGDSSIIQNETHLNNFPFERSPVDLLFLNRNDRSKGTQKLIAEKFKPSQIVAMHISPAELAETTLAHFLRRSKSKDLRFGCLIDEMNFGFTATRPETP